VSGRAGGPPSNAQVDRAGDTLRAAAKADVAAAWQADVDDAVTVIERWRASFRDPLQRVLGELVALVAADAPGSEDDVSARPKRLPSIARKLLRITTRLSQMEDIGGCRAKLPDAARVQTVLASIVTRWPEARVDDYTAKPQPTGYRAVHVVVIERGRRIEIQLRTPGQNRWADEVERWSDRLGYDLKNGEGPAELVEYFRRAAERIAIEEGGERVDQTFEQAFEALRERVRPYFRGA
jgi:ppGpp synthetase/RelA/SpoT-type nucleotidyltranferase